MFPFVQKGVFYQITMSWFKRKSFLKSGKNKTFIKSQQWSKQKVIKSAIIFLNLIQFHMINLSSQIPRNFYLVLF